jgi:hypothetical protein
MLHRVERRQIGGTQMQGADMRKTLLTAFVVGLLSVVMAVPALAANDKSHPVGGRAATPGWVYVESTGLYYQTFGTTPLPMHGTFQQIIPDASVYGAPYTEFGPGDRGFVGGRWWVDVNDNGIQDEGDAFFQCPLLGPGVAELPT